MHTGREYVLCEYGQCAPGLNDILDMHNGIQVGQNGYKQFSLIYALLHQDLRDEVTKVNLSKHTTQQRKTRDG